MTLQQFLDEWNSPAESVLVHTSGSTGQPKPLWAEKHRMQASARATCRFLGLHPGDTALLCLPLDYIAGKMMVVRALTCGLRLLSVPPGGHPLADGVETIDFCAMVPLQVQNSLQVPTERERLRQIRHLIIGGGAVDDALAAELRLFPHAVWSTYGMTETRSHIALRRLSGSEATEWYTPLPQVSVRQADDGCLVIRAPEVCPDELLTHDIVELRPDGRFRVLGRKDNVICSGGLKIHAEEVERRLQPHLHAPFLVTRRPDARLGQAVVLLTEGSAADARRVSEAVLPRYWRPRDYIEVASLPLTPTGKPARAEAERMARGMEKG